MEKIKYYLCQSRVRWALVALVAVLGAIGAWLGLDWLDYVQSWVGVNFKTVQGGALGYLISRLIMRVNLSELVIPPDAELPEWKRYVLTVLIRAAVGLSQALLICTGAVCVALGA